MRKLIYSGVAQCIQEEYEIAAIDPNKLYSTAFPRHQKHGHQLAFVVVFTQYLMNNDSARNDVLNRIYSSDMSCVNPLDVRLVLMMGTIRRRAFHYTPIVVHSKKRPLFGRLVGQNRTRPFWAPEHWKHSTLLTANMPDSELRPGDYGYWHLLEALSG